jgi:predicted helicase
MENLLNDNLSIVTTRILSSTTFQHVFISDTIGDICYISNRGKETNYYFPLWFYERSKKENKDIGKKSISYMMLFDKGGKKYQAPRSNINEKFLNRLKDIYKKPIFPEEVFYYIYAVLYSTIYRQKYQEFLKIDFPKIPVTSNFQVFKQLSKLGKNLIEVHLLKSEVLNSSSSRFEGNNGESVKEINYDERQKKVYINKKQYFSNLDTEVWNYFIGGYQILHKWLRDRKGGFLSSEEINHYIKIIAALKETIKIQKKIDSLYEKLEKSIVTIE